MFGMVTHKKQKLLLMIYFKNCMRKKKSARRFSSLLILNAFQILNNLLYVQSHLFNESIKTSCKTETLDGKI